MRINAVLLASGEGRRFGGGKLLFPVGGKPMYRHITDAVLGMDGVFRNIIVVTGCEEILREMREFPVLCVENRASSLGISHSIILGVMASASAEGWLFLASDQPRIKRETLMRFVRGFTESGKGIGCVRYNGTYGIPAVFSAAYKDELCALSGDTGAKSVIKRHLDDVFFFEGADFEFMDLDTREDMGE